MSPLLEVNTPAHISVFTCLDIHRRYHWLVWLEMTEIVSKASTWVLAGKCLPSKPIITWSPLIAVSCQRLDDYRL
jgi:hypothetical protein